MLRPFHWIYKSLYLLYFALTLILLFPVFAWTLRKESAYPSAFKAMRFWGHLLAYIPVVIPIRRGNIPKDMKRHIIVSNHGSYLDIVLSYCVFRDYFIFMGKQEIRKVPLFRIFFRDMNIAVKRSSVVDSHRAFIRARDALRKGYNLFLFPEGTISRKAPVMQAFKNGAFKLAIEEQADILPVTFVDNWKLLEDKAYLKGAARPGFSRIIVHPVISTKGLTIEDVSLLSLKVRGIIEKPLIENYPEKYGKH